MTANTLPTLLVGYLKRSVKHISLVLKDSLALNSLDKQIPMELNLFESLNPSEWVHGSDRDIGGESSTELTTRDGNLIFKGHISTNIPPSSPIQKSGY